MQRVRLHPCYFLVCAAMPCSSVSRILNRLGVVFVVVAATVAVASCAAPDPPFLESSSGVVAVSVYDSDAANEALFQGVIGWGAEGCMMAGAGDEARLIVFPKGTTLDQNDEVILPDGFRIVPGDEVGLGGGFLPPNPQSETLTALPEDCLTDEIFYASGEVAD
jgi:hypothetical protein